MDSYYRDLSCLPPEFRRCFNFDAPEALDWFLLFDQIHQLRSGGIVHLPHYDFDTSTRSSRSSSIGPCNYMVVEGLFALSLEPLRRQFDLSVFVDVEESVGLHRRLKRDVSERGYDDTSALKQHEHAVLMHKQYVAHSREYADLVLDGTQTVGESVELILRVLPVDAWPPFHR
jgi:uridine kinase